MQEKKTAREVLGFDDTWVLILGIPFLSFFIPLLFFKATLENGLLPYLPKWGISLLYTATYWFSYRAIFIYARRRFPGYEDVRRRILFTVGAIAVAYIILNQLLGLVHDAIGHEPEAGVTGFDYMVGTLMITALVSLLYESVFLYDRWKRSILEAEQLKRENVESQLEGLKSQVNPHFLFNSLNTLAYIIPEDAERAVQFVQKLSKVYRYVLEIQDEKLIALREELDFLHSYIFLLKERFGENLKVELKVPEGSLQEQVVPLSLQILFENAIKHNIISSEQPLRVELWVENGSLIVRNNLQRKKQATASTHIGLQNIRNRYAFFSAEEVDIMETRQYFTVSLPLIALPEKAASRP